MKVFYNYRTYKVYATEIETYEPTSKKYVMFYIYDSEKGWRWINSEDCAAE